MCVYTILKGAYCFDCRGFNTTLDYKVLNINIFGFYFHFLLPLFFFFVFIIIMKISFFISLVLLVVLQVSIAASTNEEEPNGSPGQICYADAYNSLHGNWNKSYSTNDPQQIYISLTDDANFARVQFATLGEIKESILEYWPKDNKRKSITIQGKVVFVFVFFFSFFIY